MVTDCYVTIVTDYDVTVVTDYHITMVMATDYYVINYNVTMANNCYVITYTRTRRLINSCYGT